MSADALYVSFDGMTDPLGRSQVLPYLSGLAELGHRIRIVSLEKPDAFERERGAVEAICRDARIDWHPLPYRSRPPIASTLLNLRALQRAAERLCRERSADFVHCRSDLPAIVGLKLKRKHGLPMLYDMRAFWPDERAEGGQWDQSKLLYRAIFRYFKGRQRELLADADELVTLSEEGKKAVAALGVRPADHPVTVIACCADFDLFVPPSGDARTNARSSLGLTGDVPLLVHVGTFGPNCLLGEMLDFFRAYRERHGGAQFLFVAPSGEEIVRRAARERGVADAVHFRSAQRDEVPKWIAAADLGLMFVRPVWSKKAASPTKLGEMLAVGLPVVANRGIGDVAEIIRKTEAGVVLDAFSDSDYGAAIEILDQMPHSAAEIRKAARPWFDLAIGIERYDAIYRRLVERKDEDMNKELELA